MAVSKDPLVPEPTPDEEEIRSTFRLSPDDATRCFYCHEFVSHPAVYWQGVERIWLHPRCVLGLTKGLVQDVERLWDLSELANELRKRGAA